MDGWRRAREVMMGIRSKGNRPDDVRRRSWLVCTLTLMLLAVPPAGAADRDLTELSLEELMNIEVTSVSKKAEKRWEAAAALYVITQQDIERSGVTSIPDALRLVPGVHVARIDSNKWAVSVRGFSSRFTDKLLVLIDGRSVYTPLFSGVYWDSQDTLLSDIERIEVIRGPGGSLWGANAVNGVINIITKNARDTQGNVVTSGGGTEERAFVSFRHGGSLQNGLHYRFYGKYVERDEGYLKHDEPADDWDVKRMGFRADWELEGPDTLTLQGDYYSGDAGSLVSRPDYQGPFTADIEGGNLLGRWTRQLSDASEVRLQWYYDRTEREEFAFDEERDTLDFDFQHDFKLPGHQQVVWGLGYRLSMDDIGGDLAKVLGEESRNDQLFSGFLQDEILLLEDQVRLTAGVKLEHNDYSGFEVQPSARALWMINPVNTIWTSVARAVRTPSRAGHEIVVTLPLDPRAIGDPTDTSEKLWAFEAGYRLRLLENASLSLAVFYNLYDDLTSLEPGEPFTTPEGELVRPIVIGNKLSGDVYGAELSSDWLIKEWWTLHGAYSFLNVHLSRDPGSEDPFSLMGAKLSPQNQFSVRSYMDLPWSLSLDTVLRYVDSLPLSIQQPVGTVRTGSYVTLDARVAYRVTDQIELSLVGRDLLDAHHREFAELAPTVQGTEVQRSVYGQLRWEF